MYKFTDRAELHIESGHRGLKVLTPFLPENIGKSATADLQRNLLNQYLQREGIIRFITWYYTPMALEFSSHLSPQLTIYDCMDELSAFQGAPPELIGMENRLFARADVMFAGGASLYDAKRLLHKNVHLFPSRYMPPARVSGMPLNRMVSNISKTFLLIMKSIMLKAIRGDALPC